MAINHYRLLGVPPDAGQRRIKSAYRSLAKRFHPDRNHGGEAATELFRQINHAYKVLSDPKLRQQYDLELSLHEGQQQSSGKTKTTPHFDPQQKFNHFINSLLDALFGKVNDSPQTQGSSGQTARTATHKRAKPTFNFHYNLALEKEKSPYVRGKDGVFRKVSPENQNR
ncbi:molecular chaperone DnaJ [Desulfuromusa kysingii]|uniref:Molecular chaperone DnaJ n=1 Tax=Desulfuromusa kysingii TaxID=37625 RepID=A0A1H3X7G3_9BACT|nr:DnaJ domain-containing protein [Desulfuromusa kysingii]SDZ95319.1 molecular chaperone DnaJ [Desulfuromusa kysingii]